MVHRNQQFFKPEANPSTNGLEAIPGVVKEGPVAVTCNRKKKTLNVMDPAPITLTDSCLHCL